MNFEAYTKGVAGSKRLLFYGDYDDVPLAKTCALATAGESCEMINGTKPS
jgi:hypothetical protein